MSFRSTTSQFNENEKNTPQQKEIAPSPLMFEEDIISDGDGVQSQLDISHTINRVISTGKSQLPSLWTLNSKIPSIEGNSYTNSRSHQMDTVLLSMSSIERVSICGLCDYAPNLNESNDNRHNIADITDIAQTEANSDDSFVRSVIGSFAKRAKLNQPPGVAPRTDAADVLGKLAESTLAINDHLVSLHDDCGKHLTMVKNIIGALDI